MGGECKIEPQDSRDILAYNKGGARAQDHF